MYATLTDEQIYLRALIGSPDGDVMLYSEQKGHINDAKYLGTRAAEELLKQGAKAILDSISQQ